MNDLERYKKACDYPSILNEDKVEEYLGQYLNSLGIKRHIKRIRKGWDIDDYPDIKKNVFEILDKIKKATQDARDAQDAQAAQDARDAWDAQDARAARAARDAQAARAAWAGWDAWAARAARAVQDARKELELCREKIKRFVCWCIYRGNWFYCSWDMSWLSAIYLGAKELNKEKVISWSEPLFKAFINGAYMLYWTQETLYWIAKPTLKRNDKRQLHSENSPALECDLEDLYYLNNIMVPAWLVNTDAGKIDPKLALIEKNVDVQREIIRKVGAERMLKACNAETLDVFIDHHTKGGNEYKLMRMKVGTINRKYLYFEHASLPGVWYAQPIPPTVKKAIHGRAWMLGYGELDDIEKMKDNEIIELLPKYVS